MQMTARTAIGNPFGNRPIGAFAIIRESLQAATIVEIDHEFGDASLQGDIDDPPAQQALKDRRPILNLACAAGKSPDAVFDSPRPPESDAHVADRLWQSSSVEDDILETAQFNKERGTVSAPEMGQRKTDHCVPSPGESGLIHLLSLDCHRRMQACWLPAHRRRDVSASGIIPKSIPAGWSAASFGPLGPKRCISLFHRFFKKSLGKSRKHLY
jgi:hypothetical protein